MKAKKHQVGMFDHMFEKGKITFLLDGYSAGSSGKGKCESLIVKNTSFGSSDKRLAVCTTNSANASHWVYDDGKKIMFEVLPSSAYLHEKLEFVAIGHGASFSVERLFEEIKTSGLPLDKLFIHPKAGIITKIDEDYEKGLCDIDGNYGSSDHDGTIAGGSTCSGSGAVRAKKVVRNKTVTYAYQVPELKQFICDVEKRLMTFMINGGSVLLQIGQGFPLSYGLGYNKQNSTSRNVTISAALDDMNLPPFFAGDVILNGRTYPIKINNKKYRLLGGKPVVRLHKNSESTLKYYAHKHLFDFIEGDDHVSIVTRKEFINFYEMREFPYLEYEVIESFSGTGYSPIWNEESHQREITWEDVEKNYGKTIPDDVKCTSLTKLPRRVFEFDKSLLHDGILYNLSPNGKTHIVINFVNWVDGEMDGEREKITEKVEDWLSKNMFGEIDTINKLVGDDKKVVLSVLGTGRESDDFVAVEE